MEHALKQAEYEYDTSTPTMDLANSGYPQESKLLKENAVLTARRALADAKSDMETSLRSMYNQIKTLEEIQKSYELALDKARDAYATQVVNYEAGLITEHTVNQVRLGILKAEIDVQKNIYTLDLLRFKLDRPYLP